MNATSLLHADLTDGAVRSLLRGVVGRQVPAADVDDVVQATLCDALAAGRVPDNAVDVRRWLVRIARNKATDHFRRRRRDVPLESDSIAVETAHTAADPDAQVFLAHAVEDLVSDPGTRSTLELSLREADGETYAEIARGSAFSAATLRQRVSRFRRAMAAAATLLIVLASAAVVSHRRSVAQRAIYPDASFATLAAVRPLEGRWGLVAWSGAPLPASPSVEIHGSSVRLGTAAGDRVYVVSSIDHDAGDDRRAERWHLRGVTSPSSVTVEVRRSTIDATVTVLDGPFPGTATLTRR